MYYLDTLPPLSSACWSCDLRIILEEVTITFKAYKREVKKMNECKEANFCQVFLFVES